MRSPKFTFQLLFCLAAAWAALPTSGAITPATFTKWVSDPSADENFFPIAVWLQNPRNAARYKAAGINLYIGLWNGPTTNQLAELAQAGMPAICSQTAVGLKERDNPIILAWMHGDEPDNAQSLGRGKGYGPPVLPERIVSDYQRIKAADPSRLVLLNLGQGVAWDNYIGRGVRRNHPEDYPSYVKGCDIASFDIYPAVHDNAEVAGKLEFVPNGVARLRRWTGPQRAVWNCIECTHISNPKKKPTPEQIRSEVWMSLIHGSRGLIYFAHQFEPVFKEAGLLADSEMLAAVTAINQQVHALAPVLNSPTITNALFASAGETDSNLALMVKRRGGSLYVFAANMRNHATTASFKCAKFKPGGNLEVLGEKRTLKIRESGWNDTFAPYAVHLYKLPESPQ